MENDFFEHFKSELKKRSVILESKFLTVPEELKMLVYFSSLNERDYTKLNKFLQMPFAC